MAISLTVLARECPVLLPSFKDARLHIRPGMQTVLLILRICIMIKIGGSKKRKLSKKVKLNENKGNL